MRTTAAIWVLLILLADATMVPGLGGADGTGFKASGREGSRATTLIHDVYELQNMSQNLNGSYELACDIDASATRNWNGGAGFAPVGNMTYMFNGTLDGKGYNITGLYINRPGSSGVGLLGIAGKGSNVGSIGVVNINVTGTYKIGGLVGQTYGKVNNSYSTGKVDGNTEVGGLVGYICDSGVVDSSHCTANVTANGSVGGLVGHNVGTVNNSYATGDVIGKITLYTGGLVGYNAGRVNRSFAMGNVNGTRYVGGLAGYVESGASVNDSYAWGHVAGTDIIGGLVGSIHSIGSVYNSYSAGNVTGNSIIGGLVGSNDGMVAGCFWDKEASGRASSSGGTGKTSKEMKTLSTFTNAGWDFENIWRLTESVTYPLLKWQNITYLFADAGTDQTVDEDVVVAFNGNESWGEFQITNYTWTFMDKAPRTLYGVQPKYQFDDPGIFIVMLKVTDITGNWDIDAMTVTVRDITPPVADAGPDQTVDERTWVTFNGSGSSDNAGIVNYSWRTNSSLIGYGVQPICVFIGPGTYIVTLTVKDAAGNRDNDTMDLTVRDITAPKANAGPDQLVEKGTIVTFNGSWSRDNVGIVNYTWRFNDTVPIELYGVQAKYLFYKRGIYRVTLNVTDAAGNGGTDEMTVNVSDLMAPVADAGPDQTVDEDTLVTFNGSGSCDNVGIANYSWRIPDRCPVFIYGARPTYEFDNPGRFVVTLNVTDAAGHWDTDVMNLTVNDTTAPVAEAGPDRNVHVETPVMLNGGGSCDNVKIVEYTWTYMDGNSVTFYGTQPTHHFQNTGPYVVTLNVTDAAGNWATDTVNITVVDMAYPIVNAGQDLVVDEGTNVTFDGSESSDLGGMVGFNWTFHDGTAITLYGVSPTYRFCNPGVFVVTLNVTNVAGNWGVDTMTVTVRDNTPPIAFAGPDRSVSEWELVEFDGSGSWNNGGIVDYTWRFDDGAQVILVGIRPTYTFKTVGIFNVTLEVADAAGNRDSDTIMVEVICLNAPIADAGPDQTVDQGTELKFNGAGSSAYRGAVNYTWTFTDGSPIWLFGVLPTYKFDDPGIFVVTLNVTNAKGDWDIDTMTVTVKDIAVPLAEAGADQTVDEGTTVRFDGSGSSDNVGIVNYTWTIDIGNERIVFFGVSPSYTFDVPGVYSVKVNVSDAAGFWNRDTMFLTVKDITPPVADAGQDRTVPAGSSIAFDGSHSTDNVAVREFFWNFTYNGKAQSLQGKKASFEFDTPGVYVVVLTVTDKAGNRGTDRVVVTVEPSVNVDFGSLAGLLWMPVLLMVMAVGAGYYVFMRRKRAGPGKPGRFGTPRKIHRFRDTANKKRTGQIKQR